MQFMFGLGQIIVDHTLMIKVWVQAIGMPKGEQHLRHNKHWRYISHHTVKYWAQVTPLSAFRMLCAEQVAWCLCCPVQPWQGAAYSTFLVLILRNKGRYISHHTIKHWAQVLASYVFQNCVLIN